MRTPDSSLQLRAAVDAVATEGHETAFAVVDLYVLAVHHSPGAAHGAPRVHELAATLDALLRRLDHATAD